MKVRLIRHVWRDRLREDLHTSEAVEHMTVVAGSVGGQHTNPLVHC